MKLSTRQEVGAPIGFVFDMLCDFESWERSALRRGASLERTDSLLVPEPGMGWEVQFEFHGKPRSGQVRLHEIDAPQKLRFTGAGSSFEGSLDIDLLELGPRLTRVAVVSEARPRTISARIVLQSAKLGKAKLTERYEQRIARFAAEIEDRYRRGERI